MIHRAPVSLRSFVLALVVLALVWPLVSPRASEIGLRIWFAKYIGAQVEEAAR